MTTAAARAAASPLPEAFVYADEVVPDLVVELSYVGADNFLGEPVDGYEARRVILTAPAAEALRLVQDDVRGSGLRLKIFDAYRPERAVRHFLRWAETPDDPAIRRLYHPDMAKRDLFDKGYVAKRSSHSRGSTVDLTLVASDAGGGPVELDMGTRFDFFGPESWPAYAGLAGPQRANRLLLRLAMERRGFAPFAMEWWHFTLRDEPFPDTYFDFPVR
ncbi:MAG: peptidase M15 [Alphaproteobacteria bacterium]|nr:peptidase M15 [Alphaproteobacteria bacterium]